MLGTTNDPRARRRDRTRREIIDAAWAQAAEHGIGGLALRELARVVGMKAPSLYTYFESKDAIYDAMFAEGYEQLMESLRETDDELAGSDRAVALATAIERFITFCQASPVRYQLMFTRAIPGWDPSADAYAVSVQSYRQMAEWLAGFGVAGESALDLWTALTSGLAAQQLANDPTGDRWRRLSGPVAKMLINYLDQNEGGNR